MSGKDTVSHTRSKNEASADPASGEPSGISASREASVASSLRKKKLERVAGTSPQFSSVILCPLRNLGNTCYFNSGVQILANCPSFVLSMRKSPLLSKRFHEEAELLCRTGGTNARAFYVAFAQLLYDMEKTKLAAGDALSPLQALEKLAIVNPTFEGRSQQDCPEMICAALSTIEDEADVIADVSVLLNGFGASHDATDPCRDSTYSDPCGQQQGEERRPDYCESLPTVTTPVTPPVDVNTLRSAQFFTVYRLMQQVNRENEEVERKVKARKGVPYNNSFQPPKLLFNSVTDGFKGYTLSEIRCAGCCTVSRTVEPFSTLMVDLPTAAQRRAFASANPNIERLGPDGEPLRPKKGRGFCWYNPLSYFRALWDLLCCCFKVNTPLTLNECLDIHFSPTRLKGSNKYHCESCNNICEADKSSSLLLLPEHLLIHIKRFRAGFFGGKKTDPVIFPLAWRQLERKSSGVLTPAPGTADPEILDLRRYMHPSLRAGLAPVPASLRRSGSVTAPTRQGLEDSSDLQQPRCGVSTFSLSGVVNHHGSSGGSGHYVVFTQKQTAEKNTWVYISDDEITAADPTEVANSEEYLLLYRKQPYVVDSVGEALRDKARYWLINADAALSGSPETDAEGLSPETTVYISRQWLQKAALLHEPGPIMNRLCYCPAAQRKKVTKFSSVFPGDFTTSDDVPHAHGPTAKWFYTPISSEDYEAFHSAFGGDPAETAAGVERIEKEQKAFLAAVSAASRTQSQRHKRR